jgi:acyl-CoA dehydrogenase
MSALSALAGGVFKSTIDDDYAELRGLVDDIGRRSFGDRLGHRQRPENLDDALWCNLSETGLARLTSTPDLKAGPAELAIVLSGLARHAGAVPLAETDLLAAWLGDRAGLKLPDAGPMTVAICDATAVGGQIIGTAADVPWARAAMSIILAANTSDGLLVACVQSADVHIDDGQNLAGEPRERVDFELPIDRFHAVDNAAFAELARRGAWARCVQVIGALDMAAQASVEHTRERVQFGRPLSKFQSVQHSLSAMAGEIERGRAAATLAVAAASDHGFDAVQTDYAVCVAKAVLGRVVGAVTTTAHQLHGAIGATAEHRLWLATMRAQSWITEFGSTVHHARRLGANALRTQNPWDLIIGSELEGWI